MCKVQRGGALKRLRVETFSRSKGPLDIPGGYSLFISSQRLYQSPRQRTGQEGRNYSY